MIEELKSSETELVGSWVYLHGSIKADNTSKRIEYLIQSVLKKISSSDDGWRHLYLNVKDLRYWELSYPASDSHGGGAPVLKCISFDEAKDKYKF